MEEKMAIAGIIGHAKFEENEKLRQVLIETIKNVILVDNVTEFWVEIKSDFVKFASEVVREIKKEYPFVKLVYVRGEYLYTNSVYEKFLNEQFDEMIFPDCFIGAGRTIYVKRNQYIIDKSDVVIFYFNEKISLSEKSGTLIAYEYATKRHKRIINVYQKS